MYKPLFVGISVVAITVGSGYYSYREHQIDRLYAEAGEPPLSGDIEAHCSLATKQLSRYRGHKVTQMLLNIARGDTPLPLRNVQREAISALAERGEPGLAAEVALLLQPSKPSPVREAAAEALRKLPCKADCVRPILHYLERIEVGEPNYEDRSTVPPGLNGEAKNDFREAGKALYQVLYGVLRRESESTVLVLVRIYGLGTDAPSNFALSLVSRMKLREACPALLQSEQSLKQDSPEDFIAPREELEVALGAALCK